jgi:hypothetical protein
MSVWMNVLGELRFIGTINPKILFLESWLTVSQARAPFLRSGRAKDESTPNRANSDTEELRREMLLPNSLYES